MAGKGFKQFLGTEGEGEQGARTPALPCPRPQQPRAVTQGQGTLTEGAAGLSTGLRPPCGSRSLRPHSTQASRARGHLPYLGCKLALLVERGQALDHDVRGHLQGDARRWELVGGWDRGIHGALITGRDVVPGLSEDGGTG